MEYAATVWDPHTTENTKKVEAVHRRAARFVTRDYRYTSSVTAMTESLSREILQHRRQQAKAIMMFRIVHAMVAIPAFPLLQLMGAATRGHQIKYRIPYCRTNTYKDSFFLSSIRQWNQLPENLTNAKSLEHRGLQGRDFSSYTALDSKMFLSCFYPALNQSWATRHVHSFSQQCDNA